MVETTRWEALFASTLLAVTMSTALSDLAAVGCLAAGGFGSFQSFDYKPFALSALFALTFILARYRFDGQQMPPYQLVSSSCSLSSLSHCISSTCRPDYSAFSRSCFARMSYCYRRSGI